MNDDEIVSKGRKFGYGNRLQPIIQANDYSGQDVDVPETAVGETSSEMPVAKPDDPPNELSVETPAVPAPDRRVRGRPRVTHSRDQSAIEKRRAQVREAQRTYQKRKDTASATEKRRVDDLLQMLSDLATSVEALLQAASTSGSIHRNDGVSLNIQRLWTTYNTVVNNPCVEPELRLLQIKNNRRLATHQTNVNLQDGDLPTVPRQDAETIIAAPSKTGPTSFDPSPINFELVRYEGTTVLSSFQRTSISDEYMGGRSLLDIVKERQAAMKAADRKLAES
ncbi:hypothetical protein GQ44DRAFT_730891 [Phaeosphaeriaceae sp. PMI808]|nr:hypothetical protein GQ44DRAFT_730891 [Phaeosphaeriaceae sp. PMI808]